MKQSQAVHLHSAAVSIRELDIVDPQVVQAMHEAARAGTPPEHFLRKIITAGVAASAAAGHSLDLAMLEQALLDADRKIRLMIDEKLGTLQASLSTSATTEVTRLTRSTDEALERLSAEVTRLVTSDSGALSQSVQRSVSALVEETRRGLQELLVVQTRSTQSTLQEDRERTRAALTELLGLQHAEVRQQLDGIRERLTVLDTSRRSRDASPARGDDYEAAAKDVIAGVAAGAGDLAEVEDTGRVTGSDGTKKGDVVITVQGATAAGRAAPRIVFESKDRRGSSRLGPRALTNELRKCRSNRGATCAIAVLPEEAMPILGHKIVLLEPRAVAVQWNLGDPPDLLAAAFHLMKLLAVSESPHASRALDPKRLREHFERLTAAIDHFNDLERQVGTADRAVTRIREIASSCRAALIRNLGELHDELLAAGEPAGASAEAGDTGDSTAA